MPRTLRSTALILVAMLAPASLAAALAACGSEDERLPLPGEVDQDGGDDTGGSDTDESDTDGDTEIDTASDADTNVPMPPDLGPDLGPCDPTAEDLPDELFFDANCDGIDGDRAAAIFVAAFGSDDNDGSRGRPLQTLARALEVASVQGKDVYVNEGDYAGPLRLVAGVDVYGGYGENWERSDRYAAIVSSTFDPADVALYGGSPAMLALDLGDTPTIVSHLELEGVSATEAGSHAIAVYVSNSPGLQLVRSVVVAGNGAPGVNGGTGLLGEAGAAGNPGTNGCEHSECDFCTCSECNRPGGGTGNAPAACAAAPGGSGGAAGHDTDATPEAGQPGSAGALPGGPAGGSRENGLEGDPGTPGQPGGPGSGGDGVGLVLDGRWLGSSGGEGTRGTPGESGGGGGGGGGGTNFCDSFGGGGGAGGSGGCGGYGGYGGGGGGASFGIFVVGAPPTIQYCDIRTGAGGPGGLGGMGGLGGDGGDGGRGGNPEDDSGRGGKGGGGGRGGRGGPGGGGGGGVSYGIFSATDALGATVDHNAFEIGQGGPGGFAEGGSGAQGQSGETFQP